MGERDPNDLLGTRLFLVSIRTRLLATLRTPQTSTPPFRLPGDG
jgi:hypothetical protein